MALTRNNNRTHPDCNGLRAKSLNVILKAAALIVVLISASYAGVPDPNPVYVAADYMLQTPGEPSSYPASLLGIDLCQAQRTIKGRPAPLDANQELEVTLYLLARRPIETSLPLKIIFRSRQSRLLREFDIEVALKESTPWRVGIVRTSAFTVNMERVGGLFSGDGYLMVVARQGYSETGAARPLMVVPVTLAPLIRSSAISPEELRTYFSRDTTPLDTSFRLGPGATHEAIVADDKRNPSAQLVLVSAFAYGGVPQGYEVARMTVHCANGEDQTHIVRSGVHTARADYDYDPTKRDHQKVNIFNSRDAGIVNASGRPFDRYQYAATFALNPELGPVESITFKSQSDVIWDVLELGLVNNPNHQYTGSN